MRLSQTSALKNIILFVFVFYFFYFLYCSGFWEGEGGMFQENSIETYII